MSTKGNNKRPRREMPSAHDIADELLKEVVTSNHRLIDPDDEDTVPDIPAYHKPTSFESQWIERRIGRCVIWGIKAIVVSALIFIGSAVGSMFWSWLMKR
jgi:pyruvate dehydrogenase complex dehydrogenase (E1) component